MPRFILTAAAALALGGLLLTACELEEAETPAASPDTAAAETPTSEPASTPEPTPTDETPGPTMTAGGRAPDGCLDTEKAYIDPDGRFAFCYPADMELVLASTGAPTVMHPLGEENRVVVNVGWSEDQRTTANAPCIDGPLLIQNQRIEDYSIADKTVSACFQDHFERDAAENPTELAYRTIEMEVPAASGFVHFDAAFTGPDFERAGVPLEEVVRRILGSAAIYWEVSNGASRCYLDRPSTRHRCTALPLAQTGCPRCRFLSPVSLDIRQNRLHHSRL